MPKGHRPAIATEYRDGPAPPPAEPVITFDDPEDEEWFERLPPEAKDDIRRRWAAGDMRRLQRADFAKSTRKRSMTQGAALFVFTETCCAVPSLGHSIAALLVGAVLGALWHRIGAGRFRCVATSVVPYAALRVAFPSDSYLTTNVFAVLGFVMLCGLAAAVGFVRERRKADDLDY